MIKAITFDLDGVYFVKWEIELHKESKGTWCFER